MARKRWRVDRYDVINSALLFLAAMGMIVMITSLVIAINGLRINKSGNFAPETIPTPTATTDTEFPSAVEKRTYNFNSKTQLKDFKVTGCGTASISKGRLSIKAYTDCETTVSITLHFGSPTTTMTYDASVSSEKGYDFGSFRMDDGIPKYISGTESPGPVTVSVPYGKHTFTWTYSKDGGTSDGADRYYVNNIVFNDVLLPGWY